jgi:hypothetical protein
MKGSATLAVPSTIVALLAVGCGTRMHSLLLPNQPPEVELFAQRMGATAYRLQWVGRDPDGRIDHYLYSLGSPATSERAATWTATTAREHVMSFPRGPASAVPSAGETNEPSIFSVLAVDALGARSAPAQVAFLSGTQAPRVEITSPRPNPLIRFAISPDFCVEWAGTAFGRDSAATRVAEFKYIVLSATTEVTVATARTNPDSVRRYYAARGWQGWTSRPGPITSAILHDLTMDQDYVFVITCFDRDGNYDPIFSFSKNMLYMRVVGAAHSLPVIGLYNESVRYYNAFGPQPSGRPDTTRTVNLEVPAGGAFTFNWFATAAPGRRITGYRWALDLANPDQPANHGWSPWDLATTSATVGPFNSTGASELHTLYIEARDDWGCAANDLSVARLVLNLYVVRATFTRDLLIVDDTRLLLDKVNPGTTCADPVNRPIGLWPTQAELDTFLFARGGVPWRCYPPGTISTPGIFSGYALDTLGTRLGINDLTVRLSLLSRYRNVIWLVDAQAAYLSKPGWDPTDPQTSMRYMNQVGTENTLAGYVRQGGRVWLAGAGAATGSMINFNKTANDNRPPIPLTLTFSKTGGELGPGRFVYDQAHWRSEFKQFKVNGGRIRRYVGRFESTPGIYAGCRPRSSSSLPRRSVPARTGTGTKRSFTRHSSTSSS